MQVIPIFAKCVTWFSFIVPFVQSFSEARGAAAAVFRLIDEGNDSNVNEIDVWEEDTEPIHDINGDIEFNNVSFTYRSREDTSALRNLSIIAHAGHTTALVGSSGSGKSTCISLFLRYYEPSSGRIMINGRPITDYSIKQLRQNIGIVLFSMSIYENIRLGKVDATRTEIEQAAQEANAHNFIMQLPNYETFVGERGIQLSGGEKQRIALARALVKQPTFLLLDEATSALDNVSEKIIQEALDRICKGRTTIVIAHRLTTIRNAHQIYVLNNGTVIEQGTHETLMTKEGGKYQSMVKHQQMERINDDEHAMMLSQKDTEDDNKSIIERTCLLSDSPTVGVNKQSSKPLRKRFVVIRLLLMNKPEWITILIGCIACVLSGATQPMFAFLLAKVVDYTAFIISGSKLAQRIRSKAFACLLRQEVAYFDRPENNSGLWITEQSNHIVERASTLAGEVIHNMRTIKQLSVEKEMLRQYSELIHPTSSRIASSISSAEAFFDLFDRIPSIDNTSTEGQELVDFRGEIKFDQVKFSYPPRLTSIILNKFQLNIKPSQCVALVGASGCGKSTIIQLLERFYDVTSGQILLDGIDIRKLNLHSVRSHFGLVSQEPVLFDLTIAENIAYGLENVSIEDIINAACRANIHQFIEQLPQGYETKVGLKGSFLSGGEKQRIAIARVLLRRPKVLLLDEATSAMDSYNEQIVQDALEQAQKEDSSRTSLMVAHRLSTIRSCDLICVLDRGHIVESGTHTELIQRCGAYYGMLFQNNLQ
ncbi:unnamed protein product [Rotaria sordida]|uniref:ABC transporter domain-containing protein n=1 Tax=Rotaria sordida TaxID=392033 RepID=A0A819AUK3_9BILA|nr:unnamed protein product [Rotaria sordida]